MPLYRGRFLIDDGWVSSAHDIRAADDGEAIERIRRRRVPRTCVLRDGARLVAIIPPGGGRPIVSADQTVFS